MQKNCRADKYGYKGGFNAQENRRSRLYSHPDKDASIDDKLVGCWKSESGEYLCFDKSGIMYQNLFDYMFAYSNYTASEGKIVSTYTTSDKKTQINTHTLLTATLLHSNNDTYSRISFSDLK